MRTPRRIALGAVAAAATIILTAGPGLAHECTNLNKVAGAGAQLVFGPDDTIEYISAGLQKRIDQGLVDFETGAGFSGLIAFDEDGDGTADFFTYIVGPNDELPDQAQWSGSVCHGVINIETAMTTCAPA